MTLCSPYRPRGLPRSKPQAIVLLRHSDGTPYGERPRDFKSYDGKGASKALMLACDRLREQRGKRLQCLHVMALEQIEREHEAVQS